MQDTDVVRYILGRECVTPPELAEFLGVKERAMRDRIRRANDAMAPGATIVFSRSRGGYVVKVFDEQALESWLQSASAKSVFNLLPSTPEERVSYLLQDLLLRSDWITLEDLSNLLFVSRSTISGDLRSAEKVLDDFNLKVEKRSRYGIRVTGSEIDRRICLASLAARARFADSELRDVVSPDILDAVWNRVNAILGEIDFKINPVMRQNLVVHIAIAVVRIKNGFQVSMEAERFERVCSAREYEVASAVASGIEAEFDVSLPEEEVAYIAIHLASKRLVEGVVGKGGDGNIEVNDEVWDLAEEMVEVVWRAFRFDFRDDMELRMNLACHLAPLASRLQYGLALENPLLSDIKACYQLPFAMAAAASGVLSEFYGAELSEDEIGYVALYFALSLERTRTARAKKRVLAVCASGAGSARLLAYWLQSEFGKDFKSVESCDASDFATRDLEGIDYIFATVPIERRVGVPVINIRPFMDDANRRDVRRVLERGSVASVRTYFSSELFFAHLDFKTREEVISFLCARCAEHDELPDDFEELVWKRELAAPTSFGNYVALPHPYETVSTRTFVAVALLGEDVDWNGRPVRAVFMVCVAKDSAADLEALYRALGDLSTDSNAIERLVDNARFEAFLNELEGDV